MGCVDGSIRILPSVSSQSCCSYLFSITRCVSFLTKLNISKNKNKYCFIQDKKSGPYTGIMVELSKIKIQPIFKWLKKNNIKDFDRVLFSKFFFPPIIELLKR